MAILAGPHRMVFRGDRRPGARRVLRRVIRRLFPRGAPKIRLTLEGLERREVRSGAGAGIDVLAASTPDSRSVTVDYRVENAPPSGPFVLGVFRSADDRFDAGDRPVGALIVNPAGSDNPTTDASGGQAGAVGAHRLSIPIPGGLPPDPSRPYVLAVAAPNGSSGKFDTTGGSAGFRTHILGVVVHGGLQSSKQTPPWELKLATELRAVGYDRVIAYNWAAESNTPGAAAKQGPRVANLVRKASAAFPATEPVDLHLIGHSEGSVVVSQALLDLQRNATPQLRQGYVKVTLLDPHAANNQAPGGQISIARGLKGEIARWAFRTYQGRAKDPLVVLPDNVDSAEVYYQHTPVEADGSNHGQYNLWGQVPVKGQAQYSDLTGPAIAHSGGNGVPVWYAFHVVPTLRDGGGAFVDPTRLTAERVTGGGVTGPDGVTFQRVPGTAGYAGTAAPGVPVALFAQDLSDDAVRSIGRAVADARGDWSLTAPPLPPGAYRIIARGVVPEGLPSPRRHLIPKVPVERLVVGAGANGAPGV